MRIEQNELIDEKGSVITVGDEVVITKVLTDPEDLDYIIEGDICSVVQIDIRDEDMPLSVAKTDDGFTVTEWLGIDEVEVMLFSNLKPELDKQMEQVAIGATNITAKGLEIEDSSGNITVHINSDGDVIDEKTRIQRIIKRQIAVYIAKNDDYGDSVLKGRKAFGTISELTRMSDKINRFNALVGKEETAKVAESLDDTVMDLVNYMAMYYSDLKAVNSLSQLADNLVKILVSPKSWLERLSREVCMEHCLDVNSKEFNKLVDKMQYLR